jgi:hypothetical protein
MDVKDKCVPIKFCCKVDFSATKIVELIRKPYVDIALRRTTIFEWHKQFREGRESVKDDECSGRPTISRTDDIAAVDKMVKEGQKVTSRLIADTLGIPKTVVLWILREDMKIKKTVLLLHDNAPAHSAAIIRQFLAQKQVATLNHPPYSPNLSPPDYLLFPKVKLQPKGARFDTTEEIQKAVTGQLNKIPAKDFFNVMKKLETCANLCITSHGSWF